MGILPVIARLPTLLRRINETARAVVASRPDFLVLIDSPDFTHRVAKKARKRLPGLKVVDYVSPTVWAWRPGRAKAMREIIDLVLALLPFEPEAHARLGGPKCVYVGHPLIERVGELRARKRGGPVARCWCCRDRAGRCWRGWGRRFRMRWRGCKIFRRSWILFCRPLVPSRRWCARRWKTGRSSRASFRARPSAMKRFAARARRWPLRAR